MSHDTPDKKTYPCHTFGKSMLAKGPLAIHSYNTHTHTQFRNWSSFKKNTTMVMLMITTTTTMTKYVLLTSRGHVEISRFDDKSLQVMEYIEYICVSVFTYAYFILCLHRRVPLRFSVMT